MESMLPSEIARLVFGYLEDQKCHEAAKSFLEMSTHLEECRTMVTNGRRFSTRVNGLRLVDIFEKFSAANAIVQERLSKAVDCEQLKQCGDLLEQLRFLIDGSRGQRFIVNINVPSQANSQASNGSPILSSNMRKRHHTGNDRERCKRNIKSHFQASEKQSEPVSSQCCNTVEATPLESLPGHINYTKSIDHERCTTKVLEKHENLSASNKNSIADSVQRVERETLTLSSNSVHSHISLQKNDAQGEILQKELESNLNGTNSNQEMRNKPEEREKSFNICTATSTEELLNYACVEVQTTPYDNPESESESNNEPIENLSLLTKELLNRTELQERIAENINKMILPTEVSLKDESVCESMGGELNTSVMVELNNAIKSIVKATETDPVFEQFLNEIIGSNGETDTSPDEDADAKFTLRTSTEIQDRQMVRISEETDLQEPISFSTKLTSKVGIPEIPLKQRLRSSSRQQNSRTEDEGDKQKDHEKEDRALDDHNAAAILSIINANVVDIKSTNDKISVDSLVQLTNANTENEEKTIEKPVECNLIEKEPAEMIIPSTMLECQRPDIAVPVTDNIAECKTAINLPIKNLVNPSGKPIMTSNIPVISENKLISEQEIMAMPTLIVCSKEEITNFLSVPSYSARNIGPIVPTSHFVPIAPKDPHNPKVERLYLKSVNVPQKLAANPSLIDNKETSLSKQKISQSSRRRNRKVKNPNTTKVIEKSAQSAETPVSSTVSSNENDNRPGLESITLYGGENSVGTMLESVHMPTISLDESISFSGVGLSPFLKFSASKTNQDQCEIVTEQKPKENTLFDSKDTNNTIVQPTTSDNKEQTASLILKNCDLITKRTPRSLLKSRSKNYRLSLSTPRRRNSHVRALDFSTPTKISSSGCKLNEIENTQLSSKSLSRTKSTCRTRLFKSPPFSNSSYTTQKLKNSLKTCRSYKVPIATRSPAPKLMGGWEKYTGVGMILGNTSPQSSSASTSPIKSQSKSSTKPSGVIKKSWDADLRKVIQRSQEDEALLLKKFNLQKKEAIKNQKHTASNKSEDTKQTSNDKDDEKCSKSDSTNDSSLKNHEVQKSSKELNQITRNNKLDANSTLEEKFEKSVKSSVLVADENFKTKVTNIETDINVSSTNNPNVLSQPVPSTSTKIIETANISDKDSISNQTIEKKIVKKYAQLKTIKTTTKNANKSELPVKTVDANIKKFESLKVSPEITQQHSQMSCVMDPETPKKMESLSGIPSTPRFLSPNSNIITPFIKANEDSSRVRSFISTPEFPPTPNIVLTPNHLEEHTKAIDKGDSNICSSYYQPSIEQTKVPDKPLNHQDDEIESNLQKILNVMPITMETRVTTIHSNIVNTFQTNALNNKLEITEFEVIKENLPREEAVKELKISTNSRDSVIGTKLETNNQTTSNVTAIVTASATLERNVLKELNSSESENESSDTSNTSSSSDSSSSSSSSSTSSCLTNTSTPFKLAQKDKNTSNKIYTDTNSNSAQKTVPKIIDKSVNDPLTALKSDIPQQQEVTKKSEDTVDSAAGKNTDTPLTTASLIETKVSAVLENDKVKLKIKKNIVEGLKNNIKDDNNKDSKVRKSDVKEVKKSEKVCQEYNSFQKGIANAKDSQKLSDCNKKDLSDWKKHIPEKSKCGLKHKVDQIKRDLFSDDENYRQRTTRSKTRQISDARKADNTSSKKSQTADRRNSSETPKEELSCVLECLKLVPASKSEITEGEVASNLNTTFCNAVEYHFIYDDAVPIRKRKRRCSSSDLEFHVSVELTDQNDKECTKLMSATAYEEIFNISPAPRKRVIIRKPSIKNIKSTRMDLRRLKDSKAPILKSNHIEPTLSPELKLSISKVDSMIPKNIMKKRAISQLLEVKEKRITHNIKEKDKQESNTKSRKRKILNRRESEQKKLCISDPQILLQNLNVDEFLTTVHGPA